MQPTLVDVPSLAEQHVGSVGSHMRVGVLVLLTCHAHLMHNVAPAASLRVGLHVVAPQQRPVPPLPGVPDAPNELVRWIHLGGRAVVQQRALRVRLLRLGPRHVPAHRLVELGHLEVRDGVVLRRPVPHHLLLAHVKLRLAVLGVHQVLVHLAHVRGDGNCLSRLPCLLQQAQLLRTNPLRGLRRQAYVAVRSQYTLRVAHHGLVDARLPLDGRHARRRARRRLQSRLEVLLLCP
mmetsp:Transcript_1467/g.3044  ORF Transcript_1467/g.3044 Transcript_1467/m.3044 type:complete len:235 (-) Transcript_1467:692-1396(-)